LRYKSLPRVFLESWFVEFVKSRFAFAHIHAIPSFSTKARDHSRGRELSNDVDAFTAVDISFAIKNRRFITEICANCFLSEFSSIRYIDRSMDRRLSDDYPLLDLESLTGVPYERQLTSVDDSDLGDEPNHVCS